MIILPLQNGKYIIKSYKDGNTLGLFENQHCYFKKEEENVAGQQWDIEYKDGYYFFVNVANGNVIQADLGIVGVCKAVNKNRQAWERMIVAPVNIGGNYVNIPPRN